MDQSYTLVALKFLDHSSGAEREDKENIHKVWGLLVDQDEDFYHVYHWIRKGDPLDSENSHVSSIMKKTVLEIWELGTDTLS